jgi:DNA-binding NtrC family response regulator
MSAKFSPHSCRAQRADGGDESLEDIPRQLNHFIEKHCRQMGKPVLHVSKATMKELQSRDWPGNIREVDTRCESKHIDANNFVV